MFWFQSLTTRCQASGGKKINRDGLSTPLNYANIIQVRFAKGQKIGWPKYVNMSGRVY